MYAYVLKVGEWTNDEKKILRLEGASHSVLRQHYVYPRLRKFTADWQLRFKGQDYESLIAVNQQWKQFFV